MKWRKNVVELFTVVNTRSPLASVGLPRGSPSPSHSSASPESAHLSRQSQKPPPPHQPAATGPTHVRPPAAGAYFFLRRSKKPQLPSFVPPPHPRRLAPPPSIGLDPPRVALTRAGQAPGRPGFQPSSVLPHLSPARGCRIPPPWTPEGLAGHSRRGRARQGVPCALPFHASRSQRTRPTSLVHLLLPDPAWLLHPTVPACPLRRWISSTAAPIGVPQGELLLFGEIHMTICKAEYLLWFHIVYIIV
jgi:hypothetical protein